MSEKVLIECTKFVQYLLDILCARKQNFAERRDLETKVKFFFT